MRAPSVLIMNSLDQTLRFAAFALILVLAPAAHGLKFEIPKELEAEVEAQQAAEASEKEAELEALQEAGSKSAGDEAVGGMTDVPEALEPGVVDSAAIAEPVVAPVPVVGDEPVAATGMIAGQVVDQESTSPVSGVAIIIEGTDIGSITDGNGNYTLGPVPSGSYTLSFVKTGYIEAKVTEFEVAAGETKTFPFALPPRPAEMSDEVFELQDFVVTAEEATAQFQIFIDVRKNSIGSVDFLSAEDISRLGDSNIASLVKRIPGVNVVEGKFAVVRGLSDRYNSTQVNGLPLPSPDPLRQSLQLDLFPSSIIETVIANKVFISSMPGNSGGGSFELSPKEFSDEWYAHLKSGYSTNENVDKLFLESPDLSSDDYFYNGIGNRVGTFYSTGTSTVSGISSEEISYRDRIEPFVGTSGTPLHNVSSEFGFGGSFLLEENVRFRFLFEGTYDVDATTKIGNEKFINKYPLNSFSTGLVGNNGQAEGIPSFFLGGPRFIAGYPTGFVPAGLVSIIDPNYPDNLTALFIPGSVAPGGSGDLVEQTEYDLTESSMTVSSGLLIGGQFVFGDHFNHSLTVTSLQSRLTEDTVTRFSGGSDKRDAPGGPDVSIGEDGTQVTLETIEFEDRKLEALQFTGQSVDDVDNPGWELNWGLSFSDTYSNVPRRTEAWYLTQDGNIFLEGTSLTTSPPFLKETTSFIEQSTDSYRVDLKRCIESPFDLNSKREIKLSLGTYNVDSKRDVEGRNAAYIAESLLENLNSSGIENFNDQIQDLDFSDSLYFKVNGDQSVVFDDDGNSVYLNNGSYPTSAEVEQKIKDAYVNLEIPFLSKFKFSGGARFSKIHTSVSGSAQLAGDDGLLSKGYGGSSLGTILNQQYVSATGNSSAVTNASILGWEDIQNPSNELIKDFVLPSLILQFDLNDHLSIKASKTKAYALPSFRELSPYFDYEGTTGETVLGNPYLQPSEVDSVDLRLDYTFSNGSYLSCSVFKKTVESPIEKIKLRNQGRGYITSYLNNSNDANISGFELEARLKLEMLPLPSDLLLYKVLKNLSVGCNFSSIEAEIAQQDDIRATYTSNKATNTNPDDMIPFGAFSPSEPPTHRRLFDQPEWLFNADASYEFPEFGTTLTLICYGQSDLLSSVGVGNAEKNGSSRLDEYTDSYFDLKARLSQRLFEDRLKLTFSASNLTDSTRRVVYDPSLVEDEVRYSFKLGRTYSFSAEWVF